MVLGRLIPILVVLLAVAALLASGVLVVLRTRARHRTAPWLSPVNTSRQNWATLARGNAVRAFVVPVLLVPIIILTIGKVFPEWLITFAVIAILTGTGFVLAWRRPGGFMGAAMGAAAGVALPLAVNGVGPAFRGAAYCFATVAVGELVALGCGTLRSSRQGLNAL